MIIYVSWSTSELRGRLAPLNRFKPSSKLIYWPFPRRYFFCGYFMFFFLSCVCYVFVRVCLYVLCGHLLGMSWPVGSYLWCLTVNLSLSHWYLGSGVVLDCINSDLCTLTYFYPKSRPGFVKFEGVLVAVYQLCISLKEGSTMFEYN